MHRPREYEAPYFGHCYRPSGAIGPQFGREKRLVRSGSGACSFRWGNQRRATGRTEDRVGYRVVVGAARVPKGEHD